MKSIIICCIFITILFNAASSKPFFYNMIKPGQIIKDESAISRAEAVGDMAEVLAKIQICVLKMSLDDNGEATTENLLDSFQKTLRRVLKCFNSLKEDPSASTSEEQRKVNQFLFDAKN